MQLLGRHAFTDEAVGLIPYGGERISPLACTLTLILVKPSYL